MTKPFTRIDLDPSAELVVAELAVLHALQTAGKRARFPRNLVPEVRECTNHAVHVRFRLADVDAQCDRLLAGVWDHLQLVLADRAEPIARACDGYVRGLILQQVPHTRDALAAYMHAGVSR